MPKEKMVVKPTKIPGALTVKALQKETNRERRDVPQMRVTVFIGGKEYAATAINRNLERLCIEADENYTIEWVGDADKKT